MQTLNTDKKKHLEAEVSYWEKQATVCARYMRRATKHNAYVMYDKCVGAFLVMKRLAFHARVELMKGEF